MVNHNREVDTSVALSRVSVPEMDAILGFAFPVLDHGYVRVIDYMGNDAAIAQAARASYTEGTKSISDDTGLARYLMRHQHTTPFEMCEIKLAFKVPMYIGEQILRQRTASVNKESGRYSIMSDDKYVPEPERLARQTKTNGQGSGDTLPLLEALGVLSDFQIIHDEIQTTYDRLTSKEVDLARELARGLLPANQYATFYWKIDLHNLFKFLHARMDSHAQWEIQQYAIVIANIVASWVPNAWAAFEDYVLYAQRFSRKELEVLKILLQNEHSKILMNAVINTKQTGTSGSPLLDSFGKGEWNECMDKLKKLIE